MKKNEPIDIVITWVDGNDKEWQKEKNQYDSNFSGDNRNIRYRDWNNLKYVFRSIEKYASWVNNVFFVTCGHLPEWLNLDNPKLQIVKHTDFIPKEFLPTFSSHPIELNLHRIKGLSNNFIYFNDDIFIINNTKEEDFFKNNVPCDSAILGLHVPIYRNSIGSIYSNNIGIINENFNKKRVLKENFFKWFNLKYGKDLIRTFCLLPWKHFTGFYDHHLPVSYNKSIFNEVWEKEYNVLYNTCTHKFRNKDDVNQWLLRYWQLLKGNFSPRSTSFGKSLNISDNASEIEKLIDNKKYKLICLNDTDDIKDFEEMKNKINKKFSEKFPTKSSFEK